MISFVIPVYNEDESLALLYGEIVQHAAVGGPFEILFVDDGSTDASWSVVRGLASSDARVKGVRFRRNFGKAAALSAGFRAAKGDVIFTLDADLQDDPAELPRFLEAIAKGDDVVSGWKKVRYDPWHKTLPSLVFNALVSWVTGVRLHDHNSGIKCYRREVFQEVRLYGELHRFIPVLAAARGFRVSEVIVNHRPRKFGHSKYGVRRFGKAFLDLLTVKFLTGFGQRPQHFLGGVGLASFGLGGLGLLYLAITWLWRLWEPDRFLPVHERALTIYCVAALLLGAQLMSIGFLAEMMIAYLSRDQESYSVAETTGEKPQ